VLRHRCRRYRRSSDGCRAFGVVSKCHNLSVHESRGGSSGLLNRGDMFGAATACGIRYGAWPIFGNSDSGAQRRMYHIRASTQNSRWTHRLSKCVRIHNTAQACDMKMACHGGLPETSRFFLRVAQSFDVQSRKPFAESYRPQSLFDRVVRPQMVLPRHAVSGILSEL
jgi:hypothetical protein